MRHYYMCLILFQSFQEPEEGEELEEGELSDEDEETRKERLKPQPVCRFYNKGQDCIFNSTDL